MRYPFEKIYTGLDRAHELGFSTYREFIEALGRKLNYRPDWGNVAPEHALSAQVHQGRWMVECECCSAYYVEPSDPVGFCPDCGNMILGGAVRPISFPANRLLIEEVLLEREMVAVQPDIVERFGTQAVFQPRLFYPAVLPRNWDGQPPEELRAEHSKVKEIVSAMRELQE